MGGEKLIKENVRNVGRDFKNTCWIIAGTMIYFILIQNKMVAFYLTDFSSFTSCPCGNFCIGQQDCITTYVRSAWFTPADNVCFLYESPSGWEMPNVAALIPQQFVQLQRANSAHVNNWV